MRFSELQETLPGVNAKMLTKQLRELEKDGIILRTVYPEVPPRVEYRMTEFGTTPDSRPPGALRLGRAVPRRRRRGSGPVPSGGGRVEMSDSFTRAGAAVYPENNPGRDRSHPDHDLGVDHFPVRESRP